MMQFNRKMRSNPHDRDDSPSGRQAAELPEHDGRFNIDKDVEALHQGQGPEFQTQDSSLRKKNYGLQQLDDSSDESAGQRVQHTPETLLRDDD